MARRPLRLLLAEDNPRLPLLAQGELSPSELLSQYFPDLEETAGQMKRIMQGLSTYAKPPMPEPRSLNMGELLAATRELVAYVARKHRVTITVDVPAMLLPVLGDRSQLMQVLVNLATNAIEAMAETGGRLSLSARVLDAGANRRREPTGSGNDLHTDPTRTSPI